MRADAGAAGVAQTATDRPCPVCEASGTRKILDWRMEHSIWECRRCGVLFARELPGEEELADFYDGFLYRKPDAARLRRGIARRKREIVRLFHLDRATLSGQRFLDYGGGTGVAFQAARELGLDSFLFEIDRQAVEYVRHTFEPDPDCLLKPEDLDRESPFDFILADNVIEHMRLPIDLVRRLHGLLAPGGRLVIKTPQAANTEVYFYPEIVLGGYIRQALRHNRAGAVVRASLTRRFWTCDPPRHLFAFSARSLREVARRAGVPAADVAISHYRIPLFEYSLTRKLVSRPARWQGLVSRAAALPLVGIELPLKLLQLLLSRIGIVSPGGVTATIRKGRSSPVAP